MWVWDWSFRASDGLKIFFSTLWQALKGVVWTQERNGKFQFIWSKHQTQNAKSAMDVPNYFQFAPKLMQKKIWILALVNRILSPQYPFTYLRIFEGKYNAESGQLGALYQHPWHNLHHVWVSSGSKDSSLYQKWPHKAFGSPQLESHWHGGQKPCPCPGKPPIPSKKRKKKRKKRCRKGAEFSFFPQGRLEGHFRPSGRTAHRCRYGIGP